MGFAIAMLLVSFLLLAFSHTVASDFGCVQWEEK